MTFQVLNMVRALQQRDAMREACDEFCTQLLTMARRVQMVRDSAELESLEALSLIFEAGGKSLNDFSDFLSDCEAIIGLEKGGESSTYRLDGPAFSEDAAGNGQTKQACHKCGGETHCVCEGK